MKRPTRAALATMASLLLVGATPEPTQYPALPREVADYRTWPRLLKRPRTVSRQAWAACRPVSHAEQDTTGEDRGPHVEHLVMVYASPRAAKALLAKPQALPSGSILAKEKQSRSDGNSPEGIAFMLKHAGGAFPESGGWEFRYYPSGGDAAKTQRQCAACHQLSSRDYVLGVYPNP